jgi:SacI homology domain
VTKSSELTKNAFQKHMTDLVADYQDIVAVDLLSDTKAREIILTKEYLKQIYESPPELQKRL